mgnify:CR=1 FL=1
MLFGDKGYIEFKYEEQIAKWAEFAGKKGNEILANPNQLAKSVSYTHLTLPTKA